MAVIVARVHTHTHTQDNLTNIKRIAIQGNSYRYIYYNQKLKTD